MSQEEKTAQSTRCCTTNQIKYASNVIHTSRYEWWSFIPVNLFQQVTKVPNFYFIILAVLQSIPLISITQGQPTVLIQLSIIIFFSMVKDYYEDHLRKQNDQLENTRTVELDGKRVQWSEIYCGQIVKVLNNEFIPADLLIIGSPLQKGACYVETKDLDGETNLKQKFTPPDLVTYYQKSEFSQKQLSVEYDLPNTHLYKFVGTGYLDGDVYQQLTRKENTHRVVKDRNQLITEIDQLDQAILASNITKFPITEVNVALRGSQLRNTSYVYGLVLYAGHDSKVMLNFIQPRTKMSQLEKRLNYSVITLFFFQLVCCFFAATFYSMWYDYNRLKLPYLQIKLNDQDSDNFNYNIGVRFGNWILIFAKFVPTSLFICIESTKLNQALLIQADDRIAKDKIRCRVQASNLNEELGQIRYIFSDKTGTLTKNLMVFKQICIDGVSYGDLNNSDSMVIDNVDFNDTKLNLALQGPDAEPIHKVFNLLTLCHSAQVELGEGGKHQYTFTSPDELALLNFCKFMGVKYMGQDQSNIITIHNNDKIEKFEMLQPIDFDSSRRRMSVIVKDLQTNKIHLFSKGADSFMLEAKSQNNDIEKIKQYEKNIYEYSTKGLRCLVLGHKELSNEKFNEWHEQYKEATCLLNDREKSMRKLEDQLENNFTILGVSAVQDRLQDNVELCIKSFRDAGIKVWVLTGDKMETAINIGYSCQLLSTTMKVLQIEAHDRETISQQLNEQADALALGGEALTIILNDKELLERMLALASTCQSVLCCRTSPIQKQKVVATVMNKYKNQSCLAIGDGANDVSMISTANVGIGIVGMEGSQAARAADYSIAEFQMLRNLLFVHGRECYRRNTQLILYNFYKNILMTMPAFWISIYNNFSGQFIYDSILYQLYNVVYTSMPIMFWAALDYEYTYDELLDCDGGEFYKIGFYDKFYSVYEFFKWSGIALYQSVIISWFFIYTLNANQPDMKDYHLLWTGSAIFGVNILLTNFKVMVMSSDFFPAALIAQPLMIGVYLCSCAGFNDNIQSGNLYHLFEIFFPSSAFYLSNFLVITTVIMLDYGHKKLVEPDRKLKKQATSPNQITYEAIQTVQVS